MHLKDCSDWLSTWEVQLSSMAVENVSVKENVAEALTSLQYSLRHQTLNLIFFRKHRNLREVYTVPKGKNKQSNKKTQKKAKQTNQSNNNKINPNQPTNQPKKPPNPSSFPFGSYMKGKFL